jgi:hypothetical protein
MRKARKEWEQDTNARQRNVVFPDTVQNEGRLWRNLLNRGQKLTLVPRHWYSPAFSTLCRNLVERCLQQVPLRLIRVNF